MASTKDAQLKCLCGAVKEDGSLLSTETFPVETDLCHCTDCRYPTGGLYTTTGNLRSEPSEASRANCTAYASSKKLSRLFCSTCGSVCFIQHHQPQQRWTAFSGIIEPKELNDQAKNVVKVVFQGYINDTTDLRLPTRLLDLGDGKIPCYRQEETGEPVPRSEVQPVPVNFFVRPKSVDASCHCGNVKFRLNRPNYEDLPADSPYHPPKDKPYLNFIPPEGNRKQCFATFCGCRSCRLALGGASLQPWLYIPTDHVLTLEGQPIEISIDKGTGLPGVCDYQSTPGERLRSFCKICGATVFTWTRARPHWLNVAVGLLRSPEGSMANDFLWWRLDQIFGATEQLDEDIVKTLLGKSQGSEAQG